MSASATASSSRSEIFKRPEGEEIDARGRIVTPGFVDIHTHYDAHVTWTNRLSPSSQHGVTTVVMGSCGVGFAPCKPQDRDRLVALMEGVEDIPEVVMTAGLPWNWESFGDYLEQLSKREYDMDVGALLPHAPLRVFVMGERAASRDLATPDDVAAMRTLAKDDRRQGPGVFDVAQPQPPFQIRRGDAELHGLFR